LGHTTTFTYDADGTSSPKLCIHDTGGRHIHLQFCGPAHSIADVEGTATLQGSLTPSPPMPKWRRRHLRARQPGLLYDALNQLTKDANGSYTYAADGSVTALLATKPMSYNVADQLVSSVTGTTTTDFAYDPQGIGYRHLLVGTATSYTSIRSAT